MEHETKDQSYNKDEPPTTQQPMPSSFGQQQQGPVVYNNPNQQQVITGQPQPYGVPPTYMPAGQPIPPVPPGYQPPAVVAVEWMPRPQSTIPGCPPGLEYLTQIDQILVHQQVEMFEMLTGYETENKYVVKNSVGQKMFFAAEESSCLQRYCCSNIREFNMAILDNFGQEIIHLYRPLACQSCLYPCCLQTMEISSPPGTVIGSIEQQWNIVPDFKVKDAAGDVIFMIKGPFCPISCCGNDVNFHVMARDGETKVGKISKQWTGFLREMYTDADVFGINFPMDMDVKMKAVLLGACFLIDFMYFEDQQNNNNRY